MELLLQSPNLSESFFKLLDLIMIAFIYIF